MKTNHSILILSALTIAVVACKEKEIPRADSPFIYVHSPIRNQTIDDNTEIKVEAYIEPKKSPIISYHVWLIDNEKKEIYNKKTDCKDKAKVQIDVSFKYDIKTTSELLLHIDAVLKDGTNIREEIPFKLVDSKK